MSETDNRRAVERLFVERLGLPRPVGVGRVFVQRVKPACGGIGFHPPVPIIVGPAAEFGDELRPLLYRKLVDGALDLLRSAHAITLRSVAGFGKREFASFASFV